jgi:hypothetical protein
MLFPDMHRSGPAFHVQGAKITGKTSTLGAGAKITGVK